MDERKRAFLKQSGKLLLGLGGYAVLGSTSAGCKDVNETHKEARVQQEQILSEQGILGKHELVNLQTIPGYSQQKGINAVSNGFLTIRDETNKEGEKRQFVEFAWKTNGDNQQVVISKLPIEKLVFQIKEKGKPTIEFKLNLNELVDVRIGFTNRKIVTNSSNPNDYLRDKAVESALIEIY